MADRISKQKRSWNMSRIRSKNTKPEIIVRNFLHSLGFRFRLTKPKLPGRPDIILKKYNTVVFVDGCFWHRHRGCKYAYNPKSRKSFWKKKIDDNVKRDLEVNKIYDELPWRILRIWECELTEKKLSRLANEIKSN